MIKIALILALLGIYFLIKKQFLSPPTVLNSIDNISNNKIHYSCKEGFIDAIYKETSISLILSDGRIINLSQTPSASGIRYEEGGLIFISKGNDAFLQENGKTTYEDCLVNVNDNNSSKENSFTDQGKIFNFSYPKDLTVSAEAGYTSSWRQNTQTLGLILAKVIIPKSYEPNTNFSEGIFTVGTSSDADAIKNCLIPQNGEKLLNKLDINGISYSKIVLDDAGAGNFYETTSYRTLRNSQCYAIEYMIHFTNIGAYSPEQGIKEFDKNKVVNELESIAQSFKFLSKDESSSANADVKVTPISIIEDSRCPKDVRCIWAGTVKINVRVTNKVGEVVTDVLTLNEPKIIAGVSVTLTDVLPEKTEKVFKFSDYKFTFSVK